MRKKITLFLVMPLAFFSIMLLFPSFLFASPVKWSENGHYYLLVEKELSWDKANIAARGMSYKGNLGYLATITSAEEQAFIINNIGLTNTSRCWLGGYQEWITGDEVDEGWQWVTGETWSYTNWFSFEPNDIDDVENGDEDFLDLYYEGYSSAFVWNDSWNRESFYIVEFGGYGTISPRTPSAHDWVLMDLNIEELLGLYGATSDGFVKMLYDTILGRVPDKEGQNYWLGQLTSGALRASHVVENFIFSQELGAKVDSMSNEEFIVFLYNSFLSRQPDNEGLENWVSFMSSGVSKSDTLRAFMDNQEWFDICNMFDVSP